MDSDTKRARYEKYHRPKKPADPDAEFLTVQETAFVFHCSVATVRRRLKALKRGGGPGRRILVSRDDRQALLAPHRRQDRSKPKSRAA